MTELKASWQVGQAKEGKKEGKEGKRPQIPAGVNYYCRVGRSRKSTRFDFCTFFLPKGPWKVFFAARLEETMQSIIEINGARLCCSQSSRYRMLIITKSVFTDCDVRVCPSKSARGASALSRSPLTPVLPVLLANFETAALFLLRRQLKF